MSNQTFYGDSSYMAMFADAISNFDQRMRHLNTKMCLSIKSNQK